ncbi:hypothetical protein BaRGS_00015192 [Batillaria attramentaria]|uniref:Uncharacterized protein n=1 Tax=Batillaria attramentaria TaxID=370345 RepID=A0ABD0L1V4_9CAEN
MSRHTAHTERHRKPTDHSKHPYQHHQNGLFLKCVQISRTQEQTQTTEKMAHQSYPQLPSRWGTDISQLNINNNKSLVGLPLRIALFHNLVHIRAVRA